MEDSRKKLYDAVSAKYDIGTFDEFSNKMNNPESQKKFYDATSKDFDIGTFDEFQGKISLKKKNLPNPLHRVVRLLRKLQARMKSALGIR